MGGRCPDGQLAGFPGVVARAHRFLPVGEMCSPVVGTRVNTAGASTGAAGLLVYVFRQGISAPDGRGTRGQFNENISVLASRKTEIGQGSAKQENFPRD